MSTSRPLSRFLLIVSIAFGAIALPIHTGYAATTAEAPIVETGGSEEVISEDVLPDEKPPGVGKEFCEPTQYTTNRKARAYRTTYKAYTVDNRGNPHPQTNKITLRTSLTKTHQWKVSGSVSTSVKVNLRVLAEGKIDATFGAEYSATTTVTTETTDEFTRVFPANTFGRWSIGIAGADVTADVYSLDRNCKTHYVGQVTSAYWPSYDLWWFSRV